MHKRIHCVTIATMKRGDPVKPLFKQRIFIVLGTLFVGFGAIGVVVPVLPTTPFLLLASACYLRGSERLHRKLLSHPVFGKILADYIQHRAVSRKNRRNALLLLWASLLLSIVISSKPLLMILLAFIGIAVTIHLLHLRTLPSEEAA